MSTAWLTDPVVPLLTFSEAIGIGDPVAHWQGREELGQLEYEDPQLDRSIAAALQLDQLTPLIEAYGDALTCRFLLGDMVVLDVKPGLTEADLDDFRQQTRLTPTVVFEFRLDKEQLVTQRLGTLPQHHVFLYLFPYALERFLCGSLQQLEKHLWREEPACRVVILVPSREVCLVGSSLAIIGGMKVATWQHELTGQLPDAERLHNVYDWRDANLRWQETWLTYLTPLHLSIAGDAEPGDGIANALGVHRMNLIVLYTADRVATRSGRLVATYAGIPQAIDFPLDNPSTNLGEGAVAHLQIMARIFDWVYEEKWVADRLLLIQIIVAQSLREVRVADRYQRLLERADPLYQDLQRQWKSFMAGKVSAYTEQVQALEDYVAATVQLVADQIAAISKSLSDTMLAAVAALLASFIGAIFQSKFNAAVFSLGMLVYAVYVLSFPLTYNMVYQRQRFSTLMADFQKRRQRFEDRLSREQVEEIVGTRVGKSQEHFEHWFKATVAIYIVAIVLAVAAALLVPGLVSGTSTPPKPKPSPTSIRSHATPSSTLPVSTGTLTHRQ